MSAPRINLLPDVKQVKLKDKEHRSLAISLCIGVVLVCVVLLVLTFLFIQSQNVQVALLNKGISDKKAKIANFPDVQAILAVQMRLDALPSLYSQRAYVSQLATILTSNEPNDVGFTSLSITPGNQINITAEGKSYMAAAKIARAMEVARVKPGSDTLTFTNVQLSAVTLNGTKTTYSITANVAPEATSGN